MATRKAIAAGLRMYYELVDRFPLIPIRDDAHLDAAIKVLDGLLAEVLDECGQAYLDVLTGLVEAYEAKHVPIRDASEADVLRELMRANGLSQPALVAAVRISQSTISAILTGRRSLTKGYMIKLAGHFGVLPAVFLPDRPKAKRKASRAATKRSAKRSPEPVPSS